MKAATSPVESLVRGGQAMAIRAQQRQVLDGVVLPIAINVLDLHHDTTGDWVPLAPTTPRAFLADSRHEEFSDETIGGVMYGRITASQKQFFSLVILPLHLTGHRAVLRRPRFDFGEAIWTLASSSPFFCIHTSHRSARVCQLYGTVTNATYTFFAAHKRMPKIVRAP